MMWRTFVTYGVLAAVCIAVLVLHAWVVRFVVPRLRSWWRW